MFFKIGVLKSVLWNLHNVFFYRTPPAVLIYVRYYVAILQEQEM